MTISERIKHIRMNQPGGKMSREAFAERLGMTAAMIQNIEEADTRLKGGIPDSTLKLISATFHVDYRWLTQGIGDMSLPMDTDQLVEKYMPNESVFAKSIMKAFARLPDEEWIRLRDMIDQIKKEATE